MSNSEMPKEIRAAFDEVRKYRPDARMVLFNCEGKWNFMNKDGESIRWHPNIDTSILEDAADSLDSLPAFFHLTPQKNKTPDDFTVGTFYKNSLCPNVIYFCVQSELGKHMIIINDFNQGYIGVFCKYTPDDADNQKYWNSFTERRVTLKI